MEDYCPRDPKLDEFISLSARFGRAAFLPLCGSCKDSGSPKGPGACAGSSEPPGRCARTSGCCGCWEGVDAALWAPLRRCRPRRRRPGRWDVGARSAPHRPHGSRAPGLGTGPRESGRLEVGGSAPIYTFLKRCRKPAEACCAISNGILTMSVVSFAGMRYTHTSSAAMSHSGRMS
jgi:hypothetical protein